MIIIFLLHESLTSGNDHTLQSVCWKNILDYFTFGDPPAHGPNLALSSSSSESWQIAPV